MNSFLVLLLLHFAVQNLFLKAFIMLIVVYFFVIHITVNFTLFGGWKLKNTLSAFGRRLTMTYSGLLTGCVGAGPHNSVKPAQ